jgi:2,3-bisphosphoglycerate-dependent phosphoglycerate mutase
MTTLYLVRHAQSRILSSLPESDWPLSTVGTAQAQQLIALLEPLDLQVLYSSPYLRCQATINPFAQHTGRAVLLRPDLRERQITTSIIPEFPAIWERSWQDFHYALPGCESSHTAQKRIQSAVHHIVREVRNRRVGICTHGNVIGLLLNAIDPTFGKAATEALRNPDVVKLVADEGQLLLWDRDFTLPRLAAIATDHTATPIERIPGTTTTVSWDNSA